MGVTNPTAASLGTPMNQSSYSRLLSLNAIDDLSVTPLFCVLGLLTLSSCLFAPPTPGQKIGDSEAIEVAWCVRESTSQIVPNITELSDRRGP